MFDDLSYYPDTGDLTWLVSVGSVKAGTIAGVLDHDGYRSVQYQGKKYRAASIAWYKIHGYWPKGIDHRDRNRDNNRLSNLREVTHQQNCLNRDRKLPSSGFRGVYAKGRKWEARVTHDGQTERLGVFTTPELASAAYEVRARQLHEEYFPDV